MSTQNPAQSNNSQAQNSGSNDKASTINLTGRGYFGQIRVNKPEGKDPVFYVDISLLDGNYNNKASYKNISVRIKKKLIDVFEKALEGQTFETIDNHERFTNSLSGKLFDLKIFAPTFEPWSNGTKSGVNIGGLLSSYEEK